VSYTRIDTTLVIGYGNTLRRDDGIGPFVATAINAWHLPGVSALAVAQLTPELASDLAVVRRAVFVDARPVDENDRGGVEVQILEPSNEASRAFTHAGDPSGLLALAREVYGTCPKAWLVTVPLYDLRHGEGLSRKTNLALQIALRRIGGLLS
jgi:hydrogenase maturation protease